LPGGRAIPEIRILRLEHSFACADGETILAAALRQGLYLRHGCKKGGCGTCKAKLVEGDVEMPPGLFALSSDERADGWILLCSSRPTEPCTIDVSTMELSEKEFLDNNPT
jgi:ferredoxin